MLSSPDPRLILLLIALLYLVFPPYPIASDVKEHYLRGQEFEEKGAYGMAIDEYKAAISLNPYYKEAYNALGRVYHKSGLHKEAIESFKKAIELDPNFPQPLHNLALVYEDEERIDEAIEELKKALSISPAEPRFRFDLGRLMSKAGMVGDAIQEYEEVLRIDPNFVWAWINLGKIYSEMGDSDLATVYYKEAAARDPKNPHPHIHLGDLYLRLGLDVRAASAYKDALRISPEDTSILLRLSKLYASNHEWDEAIHYSRKIVDISPETRDAHYIIGYALQRRGDWMEAKEAYEEALEIDPYDEVARHYLGNLLVLNKPLPFPAREELARYHIEIGDHYLLGNRIPLATYEYKRAILMNPQDKIARWRLAELYARQGLIHQGIDELRKAIELDPHNEDARLRLEQMYRRLERSISRKEEIDPQTLPPSGVKMILIHLHSLQGTRPGVSSFLDAVLHSILSESPQIHLVPGWRVEMAMRDLGIEEVKMQEDLFRIGNLLGADLIFFGNVVEEPNSLKLDGRVVDLETMSDVITLSLTSSSIDRMKAIPSIVAKRILDVVPIQGLIVKAKPNEAITNLGARHGLKVASKLNVIKKGVVTTDPLTGEEVIGKEEVIGQLEVVELEDNLSRARILTYGLYETMKRFDIVRLIKEEEKD